MVDNNDLPEFHKSTEYTNCRTLTPAERESIKRLIGFANEALIDRHTRQGAIDALSIAQAVLLSDQPAEEPESKTYGIVPGNVPTDAFPPGYDPHKAAENVGYNWDSETNELTVPDE